MSRSEAASAINPFSGLAGEVTEWTQMLNASALSNSLCVLGEKVVFLWLREATYCRIMQQTALV